MIEEPLGRTFNGLPECCALSGQKALEEKHGCKLEFMYVKMGGSIWPKGDPRFKDEPTVSVWRRC
jgi:hypothetical protein